MSETITITPGQLTLNQVRRIYDGAKIKLDEAARPAVEQSAQTVADIISAGKTVYGINTGFGRLAKTTIPNDKLVDLQKNLVMSHATGIGALLDDDIVRVIMALKVNALARGHSGIRWSVIESIAKLMNEGIYPCIPAKGSVGASGDLAPLAHLSCALLGIGNVRVGGKIIPAKQGLAMAGLDILELGPKEGLALLNGTQTSTALALVGLFQGENVFASALVAGALTVDAAKGSDAPFDPRIQSVRGHQGQMDVAKAYLSFLQGSEIRDSHLNCDRVQDPYSLRCQPQVMGACLDHLRFTAQTFGIEANAVSDNPLVFSENGDVISGGNFHAEPVAMSADVLAIALSEVGAISERRIALMMDPAQSGLPAFLVEDGGVNSGFMIAQVTAAALASENKTLAHPASIDSLPTSANQEDHVSMATFAARRLADINENVAGVIAVEMLCAAQGIDFHAPMRTSEKLQKAMDAIRSVAPHYDKDRYFHPEMEAVKDMVLKGAFQGLAPEGLMPSY
ncbi:histidine ammonia-lyase [Aestuariispira insulae]|uniref:Histidine ammonia-lyase n=1 Tax=Aestuariispira insulae TaxID=1461337 RepID=A0A3D9HNB9_9PROT|nr:histidine ammonia-lyase [Aestuariispira insulae]RED50958.1 histidine ammonia-lyase [Aestuariispira insulae]